MENAIVRGMETGGITFFFEIAKSFCEYLTRQIKIPIDMSNDLTAKCIEKLREMY